MLLRLQLLLKMKLIISLAKYALVGLTVGFVYLLIIEDKYFCEKAGISPQEFGARYTPTLKQLCVLRHGYYEYNMTKEAFHDMRKELTNSAFWLVRTHPLFDVPHFHYTESKDCSWFLIRNLQSCIVFMAYDEHRNILYSGYYDT